MDIIQELDLNSQFEIQHSVGALGVSLLELTNRIISWRFTAGFLTQPWDRFSKVQTPYHKETYSISRTPYVLS